MASVVSDWVGWFGQLRGLVALHQPLERGIHESWQPQSTEHICRMYENNTQTHIIKVRPSIDRSQEQFTPQNPRPEGNPASKINFHPRALLLFGHLPDRKPLVPQPKITRPSNPHAQPVSRAHSKEKKSLKTTHPPTVLRKHISNVGVGGLFFACRYSRWIGTITTTTTMIATNNADDAERLGWLRITGRNLIDFACLAYRQGLGVLFYQTWNLKKAGSVKGFCEDEIAIVWGFYLGGKWGPWGLMKLEGVFYHELTVLSQEYRTQIGWRHGRQRVEGKEKELWTRMRWWQQRYFSSFCSCIYPP